MVLVPAWPLRTKLISMPLSRSKGATARGWAAIALALPGNASVPSAAASAWSNSVAVPCHASCVVSTARTAVTTAVASGVISYALATSLIAVTPNYRDKLAAGRDLCRTWIAPDIGKGAASLLGKVGRDASHDQEMFTGPRTRMLN